MKDITKLKAWMVVDSEVGVIDTFATRDEAREQKRYATQHGHSQIIVKLVGQGVVR